MTRATAHVRAAEPTDIPALVELMRSIERGRDGDDTAATAAAADDDLSDRFASLLGRADRTVLVAVDMVPAAAAPTGGVVGMLAARRDEVGALDLTPVVHVTHLVVAPASRRRGVGRGLLAAAVQLAEAAGIETVVTSAAAGSRESNRYLARLGFAPLVVNRIASTSVLRRSLGLAEPVGRDAAVRRARLVRQRAVLRPRALGRGA